MTKKDKKRHHIKILVAACSSFTINGLIAGWSSPALMTLTNEKLTPYDHALDAYEVGKLMFLSFCGIYTMLFAGVLCNRFGRKKTLVFGCSLNVISWVIVIWASSLNMLYVGKTLGALAFGISYPSSVLYVSEIAAVPIRGFALSLLPFFMFFAALIMYCIGPFTSLTVLSSVALFISCIILFITINLPESPVYYLLRGKRDKAEELFNIIGTYYDQDKQAHKKLMNIANKNNTVEQLTTWRQFKELCLPRNRWMFFCCFIVSISPQTSGFAAMLVHMTEIFHKSGSSIPPHIATIIVGSIKTLFTLATSLLIERIGRKPLLLVSSLVATLTNTALGVMLYLEYVGICKSALLSYVPLVCLILYMIFYGIGLGVLPSTFMGELLDPRLRSLGSGILIFIEAVTAVTIVSTFSILCEYIGAYTLFWIFALCSASVFVFVLFYIPETRGKTFEEIKMLFL